MSVTKTKSFTKLLTDNLAGNIVGPRVGGAMTFIIMTLTIMTLSIHGAQHNTLNIEYQQTFLLLF